MVSAKGAIAECARPGRSKPRTTGGRWTLITCRRSSDVAAPGDGRTPWKNRGDYARIPQPGRAKDNSAAFTLIELILLMAVLTITAAIVVPSLSKFMVGRTESAEAQRLLSLIHYGQTRAVSEGLPVILWLDAKNGTYGLQIETGYTDGDTKAVDFVVDKDVGLGVVQSKKQPAHGNAIKLPAIHFLPDNTFGVASVTGIYVQDRDNRTLWITQSANGLTYEIEDQATYRQMHRQ